MKINLLPKEERPLKQSEVRWEFLVGLIGILALGAVLLFSWIETAKLEDAVAAHRDALQREAQLQKQVVQVQELRKNLAALENKQGEYHKLLPLADQSLGLLPALTGHALPNLWVEALIWRKGRVELSGYTRDITSLSRYLNFLNEHSQESVLQAIRPHEGSGFSVFSIEAKGVGGDDPA